MVDQAEHSGSWSRYRYTLGDPANATDAPGLDEMVDGMTTGEARTAVVSTGCRQRSSVLLRRCR